MTTNTFAVYKISGPLSTYAYYGYCQVPETTENDLDHIKQTFLKGAHRSEQERGDIRLFQLNNEQEDTLSVEVLDAFSEEFDAWMCRNEQRAIQVDSITGPTQFPCHIAERAAKERGKDVEAWAIRMKQKTAATARQAYALGLWTKEAIMELATKFNKQDIVKDLDALSPVDFNAKYFMETQV